MALDEPTLFESNLTFSQVESKDEKSLHLSSSLRSLSKIRRDLPQTLRLGKRNAHQVFKKVTSLSLLARIIWSSAQKKESQPDLPIKRQNQTLEERHSFSSIKMVSTRLDRVRCLCLLSRVRLLGRVVQSWSQKIILTRTSNQRLRPQRYRSKGATQ